jgi:hypothetical protein
LIEDCLCASLSGPISIEHKNRVIEVVCQQVGLLVRERRSHECHNGRIASLMDLKGVEEAFHDDDAAVVGSGGAVEIEQYGGFPEAGWKAIFRRLVIDSATSVRDELPMFVVDRNDDTTVQESAAAVHADPEGVGSFWMDVAALEINVAPVDMVQCETQRAIRRVRSHVRFCALGTLVGVG